MNYPQLEVDDLAAVIRASMAAQKNDVVQTASPPGSTDTRAPELKLQPDFQSRSDHHYHVNDLLQFHDRAFVQAAYRAVLKRSPDDTEFHRALKQLRDGDVNKIDLLAALRFSNEGRAKQVQLDGLILPAAIRRLGQLPVIGYGVRLGIAFMRLPNLLRDQRQFAGYVLARHDQIAEFVNGLSTRVAEFPHEVSRLTETLSKQMQTLAEEQQQTFATQHAELECATTTQFNEVHQQLIELDRRFNARLDQRLDQQRQQQEQQLATIEANAKDHVEVLQVQLGDLLAALEKEREERQSALTQALTEHAQLLATAQNEIQSEIARLQLQLRHSRSELAIQSESIRALSTAGSTVLPAPSQGSVDAHHLDALYAALEDRFRGTRDEIKERFRVYLPYIQQAAPVVDLGCGRGEWLELLKESAIEAHGVDTNRIQVDECRARGLKVNEEDFVAHLRGLAESSVGAVTGFHIVEHVPLETLLSLLNEALRVLRPGGVVIFETPNPENLIVGSNYFYMDPTHRHPLPSELMEFLLDSRGFEGIEILKLHPWDAARIEDDSEIAARLNAYFYGPMDYAVVGRKVRE